MKTTESMLGYREELFRALANSKRLQILDLLCKQGEMCVCDLTLALGSEQSNVSQHLAVLKEAGILGSRREGTRIIYWIEHLKVCRVIEAADEHILEVLGNKEQVLRELIGH